MPRKTVKRRQNRRNRHKKRGMRGGAFSPDQFRRLTDYGFNEFQIEELAQHEIPFDEIIAQSDAVMMQEPDGFIGNSDDFAEIMMDKLLRTNNVLDDETMPLMEDDYTFDDDMSVSTQGPMDIEELNVSQNEAYTTDEEDSVNGGRRRKTRRHRRRNSTKKGGRRRKSHRRRRTWKGGRCFGNGVGANTNDPNFSIYNTRALQLFPYKP